MNAEIKIQIHGTLHLSVATNDMDAAYEQAEEAIITDSKYTLLNELSDLEIEDLEFLSCFEEEPDEDTLYEERRANALLA